MSNVPLYYREGLDFNKSDLQFKIYFEKLIASKRYSLLRDIFSKNEESLNSLFLSDRTITSSEVAFLFLVNLSSEIIHENRYLIEKIFTECESDPFSQESINIFSSISVLVSRKQKGINVSFLNANRLLNNNLPIDIRIDLSKLLAKLDPIGHTFIWDVQEYPYLMPAKMLLYKDKPLEILIELLLLKKPEKIILDAIVQRPLITCLENLLIKNSQIRPFIEKVEPYLLKHWSKPYFDRIIDSPFFNKNQIRELINLEKVELKKQISYDIEYCILKFSNMHNRILITSKDEDFIEVQNKLAFHAKNNGSLITLIAKKLGYIAYFESNLAIKFKSKRTKELYFTQPLDYIKYFQDQANDQIPFLRDRLRTLIA